MTIVLQVFENAMNCERHSDHNYIPGINLVVPTARNMNAIYGTVLTVPDDLIYLWSLEQVVLLWVVLEEDAVSVCPRPVAQLLQDLLMVLQGAL